MDLEQFYQRNYKIVFCYLYSLCQDLHTAEDLTSETFVRAIQKIDTFDETLKASTWLCAIGRNLYYNERKKLGRQTDLEQCILADTESAEDAFLRRETLALLVQLIGELEEPKRQVFLLRRQGLSFRQIGDALGKTETWARVTYFRVKEALLQRLEESK